MAATKEAPSTAVPNPLEESFAKITGRSPLSVDTGQSLIDYDAQAGFRAPAGDIINISGDPGTGATTSETWSHDIALENLRRQQLEFEYQQRQDALAQGLRQQEARRSETQLGLQRAAGAREAAMSPYQLESARIGTRTAAAELVPKQMAAVNAQRQMAADTAYWNAMEAESRQLMGTPGTVYSQAGDLNWYRTLPGGGRVIDPLRSAISRGQPIGQQAWETGQTQQPSYNYNSYSPYNQTFQGRQGYGGQMARY